jgi:hypothetical protein
MATSGRGSGIVGYNVQNAVDTKHHLIVSHEVTLDVVADRGYYAGEEILACEEAGITVYLPKPMTSPAKAEGRFGKQDFIYVAEDDVYRCPAGERLTYRYTSEEEGKTLRSYWTTACQACSQKAAMPRAQPERGVSYLQGAHSRAHRPASTGQAQHGARSAHGPQARAETPLHPKVPADPFAHENHGE